MSLLRVLQCLKIPYRNVSVGLPVSVRKEDESYREERVVVTKDGAVICCWHPQPKFPYEYSRPIPRADIAETSSLLKVQVTEDMKELYHHKPERFHRRDLMKLTWTTKHRWFPTRKRQEKEIHERRHPREKPFL